MTAPAPPVQPPTVAPIELRHLRYLLAVAEELSFTRAARRLNVGHHTRSEGIAQLPDSGGGRLFDRTRPGQLTHAGVGWRPSARDALDAVERARELAGRLRDGAVRRLRVGLAATAAFPLTPTIVEAFREGHPEVAVSTRHFDFGDPTGGLLTGESDVAIVRPPFSAAGLRLLVIASEPRYVALSCQHPLAPRTSVRFAEIADEP